MIVHGWAGWVALAASMVCAFAVLLLFAALALKIAEDARGRRRRRRRGGIVEPLRSRAVESSFGRRRAGS